MSCARLAPESEAHAGKAFAAASTAASTSASDPFGTVSTTSPFAGLRTSSVFPLFAPTVSPAINMLVAIYESSPCGGRNATRRQYGRGVRCRSRV